MGREPPAPGFGLIDDVVVDERRRVNEFDHGGVEDRAVAAIAAQPRGHEQDGRPHAFAAAHLDIAAHLGNELDTGLEVASEFPLDARQLIAHRLEDLIQIRNRRRRLDRERTGVKAHR